MKALSIRQPWAWLIVRPDLVGDARASAARKQIMKDIENRSWPTKFRGRVWVHASAGMTYLEYGEVLDFLRPTGISLPPYLHLQRGGIVGAVDIVDCVRESSSPWFFGEFGFVLRDAVAVDFVPFKGALGFFDVPETLEGLPTLGGMTS